MKRKGMLFSCQEAWPQCNLGSGKHRPENGSLNYTTIMQLELFIKEGKWDEIPYIEAFMLLYEHKSI